jgi:hypothetical protein
VGLHNLKEVNMDRDTTIKVAQDAIKAQNNRLITQVLKLQATRPHDPDGATSIDRLPQIAVTCATGWECYAIVAELIKTRRFRVRALYRTPGTHAAARLETLRQTTEQSHPGLLTLRPHTDLFSNEILTEAFADCAGVVIYVTANVSKAGRFRAHGNDPEGGRRVVMRQVLAILAALKASPSVTHSVMVTFPRDKVRGFVPNAPEAPWFIQQRLRLPTFFREQGINLTCIHRPAYYYNVHRVDYTVQVHIRGDTALSRTTIRENNVPGIMPPDFVVNWVDVRDVGKWVGTCFAYPEVFSNESFSIASCALTGRERANIAQKLNKHGTTFKYKRFPPVLMRMIGLFNDEVSYPLKYTSWYNDQANAYDFACNEDLADLEKIHSRWTFEKKLRQWGIDEIKPRER